MIKIVSFVLFIVAFIWTWILFHNPADMGVDVHAGIQSKLGLLIEDTLKEKRPSAQNFKLSKMYTEKIDNNKVKAFFSYQFNDTLSGNNETDVPANESTTQKISGEATLIKTLSENPEVQKWTLQDIKIDNQAIDFKEGLVLTSEQSAQEQTAPPQETNTGTPESHDSKSNE